MIAIGGVTGDRVNFAFDVITSSPANRQNAHLKVGSADGTNTAILLGSANATSNVSLVKLHGGVAEDAGISVFDQSNKYAPLSANLLSQATIQGTDTDVAPLLPAGSVIAWVAGSAPSGWLLCQGQAISRSTYAALFAKCSTDFGAGDGSSTFNVPDLRGRTVTMAGTNISRAGSTAEFASGVTVTTASGSASLTTGSVAVSSGAKDAGASTVINSVSSTGHTHSVTIPTTTLMYIIKT
jgi:microcystin-dependent protein